MYTYLLLLTISFKSIKSENHSSHSLRSLRIFFLLMLALKRAASWSMKDRAVAVAQWLLMIQKDHIDIVHSQGTMQRHVRS